MFVLSSFDSSHLPFVVSVLFPVVSSLLVTAARRRLNAEDVLRFKAISDAQITPDGQQVAFVVGDSYKFDSSSPKSTIWIVTADGKNLRPLTHGIRTDNLPRWSPDGKMLGFASDRLSDGQKQIYVLPIDGGEARRLTEIEGTIPTPRGLNSLQWSPNGKCLAFLKEDAETADEKFKREQKDDAIEFEKHPKYVRLWIADFGSGQTLCVSPRGLQIWEFAWSSDSEQIAATVSDVPYEWAWYSNRLVRFSILGGVAQTLFQHRRQVALPRWSPDGRHIAFLCSFWSDRGVTAGDVWSIKASGANARNLTEGIEASFGWMEWQTDSLSLITVANERGGMSLSKLNAKDGQRTVLWHDEVAFAESFWPRFSMSAQVHGSSKAGIRLAFVREDALHPRDVWIAEPGDSAPLIWKQATQMHRQAIELELGRMENIRWQGAEGMEMQGLLIYPAGYQQGQRVALVTWVHGGPAAAVTFRYATDSYNQLLAARGMAVFLPNYRGSAGRGVAFVESNIGDLGGKDFQDILLGIEHCINKGVADPDRLGIGGWSYGGFMSAWAVTQTNRFKAAVMGAGISNWLSFHGNSILADWDAMHLNASPYEREGPYQQFSPINFVTQVRTPTLILHGEKDEDVPPEQSYQFYRALRDLKIETELVIYPREAHGPNEKMHLQDLMRRIPDWFEKYLKP